MKNFLTILTITLISITSITWSGEKGHGEHSHGEHGHHGDPKAKKVEQSQGGHPGDHVATAIKGEVMDLTCYLSHPKDGQGKDHAKCAQKCIKKGLPVGIKTKEGTLYLAAGADHSSINEMLAPFAGKVVTVTGTVKEESGMKMILVNSVTGK